ncbi:hypothetical protein NQ314_021072 [Rhamnusium bicolor]|uniref:Uncharacterized protein n=1 Tax=Rhamnusium bicolor TaxID=1586634 RepID=A0AAV8WK09_9CUCU|nr:hypothetical protein NQ314_021072 [Rhamnusium bicolor]
MLNRHTLLWQTTENIAKTYRKPLKIQQNGSNNINHTNENWNWDINNHQDIANLSVPDLKKQIADLESEKADLIAQLEQLDLENQQNVSKIVNVKDKLQEENSELKDNCLKLTKQYNAISTSEEQLRKELKELQTKYGEIQRSPKQPDDEYREKYETTLQDNQKLKFDLEEAKKEIGVLKSSNATLQKILEDSKVYNEEEMAKNIEKIKRLEGENKIIYMELQKAKESIKHYEKKSFEDAENCQKLAFILESYEKQVSSLKKELEDNNAKNEKLELSAYEDNLKKFNEKIEDINKTHQMEISSLKDDLDNLKTQNEELQSGNNKLADENSKMAELQKFAESQEIQINSLTEEINILRTENYKLQSNSNAICDENECDKPSDFQHCSYEDDPQIAEFSKQVENILKILLDFKCKCEIFEKKVYDLSEEKTKILTEKNHEIEKLIQNSEILSQEVITKTQTIKDYENEYNYKSNSGLQTISESNEDNMVLLESQLENANKRIEDLEKIIDDFERQQKEKLDLESEEQLVTATQQMKITDTDNTTKDKDYQELLNSFDQLQIEYDTLKFDLETAKEDLRIVNEENEEMKCNLEKIKIDYENTEYQLSENNINIDSLKDEIEGYRKKIDILITENNKLHIQNKEISKSNDDIRSELSIIREKLLEEEDNRKHFEIQVRNLTEKLQNAKMTETSLKLQYDTVSKEVMALSEAKHNLETSLNKTNSDLAQFQNSFVEIQRQNDKLMKEYEELRKISENREKQITNFEGLVGELQAKLQKYEKLAIDENEELFKKLSINDNTKIIQELKSQLEKYENLALDENEQLFKNLSINETENQPGIMDVDIKENSSREYGKLKQQFNAIVAEKNNLQLELHKLNQIQVQFKETLEKHSLMQQQLQEITNSRNDLINIVTTKHQESVVYHKEIQRLSQLLSHEAEKCKNLETELNQLKNIPISNETIELKNQEIEKLTDQNNFLKEKCEVMAKNLLEEQSKVKHILAEKLNSSEKELALQKKLDRLQTHLIELEEHYTQELIQAEQKNAELRSKVNEIEEREKSSSTIYTSVSIRANQQVESLQNQLQIVVGERDNKEKDVFKETERIRRQINTEKQVQEELKVEISSLKSQLEESKQGLQAAARLSDQLEHSKKISHFTEGRRYESLKKGKGDKNTKAKEHIEDFKVMI